MKKNHIYPLESFQKTLESFIQKCKEKQIWFSLINKSLLSAMSQIDYFLEDDYLEVLMTYQSFEKLQSHYKDFVVSPNNNINFWYSNPFFVEPKSQIVIKINIVVPANIKKAQRFYNPKNRLRQKIGYWNSNEQTNRIVTRKFFNFLGRICSALVWEEVYTKIYHDRYQGFFIIDDFRLNINQNWLANLTFRMENVEFLGLTCPIIEEAKTFLVKHYGWNWNEKMELKTKTISFGWIKGFLE